MKYYILLLGLCLLGCNSQPSKQDKSIQPVIQKDDKFTNHYELPLTESEKREVLHYADSVLQVKGIKLVIIGMKFISMEIYVFIGTRNLITSWHIQIR